MLGAVLLCRAVCQRTPAACAVLSTSSLPRTQRSVLRRSLSTAHTSTWSHTYRRHLCTKTTPDASRKSSPLPEEPVADRPVLNFSSSSSTILSAKRAFAKQAGAASMLEDPVEKSPDVEVDFDSRKILQLYRTLLKVCAL